MKYALLRAHLQGLAAAKVGMSFDEVAAAARVRLPASAFKYAQWWQNDPEHHVQARAWTEAGFKTENVDLRAQRVDFVRVAPSRGVREMQEAFDNDQDLKTVKVHPMIGAMKGTFTIKDWDVTKPALDQDELAEWGANIDRKFDEIAARRVKPK